MYGHVKFVYFCITRGKVIITFENWLSLYRVIKVFRFILDIHVRETRPPNFDEKKKYAVLFNVYVYMCHYNRLAAREDISAWD
jgi:hypothetical protein